MLSQRGFKREIKDNVFKTLSKHPEGLTFSQKYIYELKGEGTVSIRDLKTLKLCYLKKYFKGSEVIK